MAIGKYEVRLSEWREHLSRLGVGKWEADMLAVGLMPVVDVPMWVCGEMRGGRLLSGIKLAAGDVYMNMAELRAGRPRKVNAYIEGLLIGRNQSKLIVDTAVETGAKPHWRSRYAEVEEHILRFPVRTGAVVLNSAFEMETARLLSALVDSTHRALLPRAVNPPELLVKLCGTVQLINSWQTADWLLHNCAMGASALTVMGGGDKIGGEWGTVIKALAHTINRQSRIILEYVAGAGHWVTTNDIWAASGLSKVRLMANLDHLFNLGVLTKKHGGWIGYQDQDITGLMQYYIGECGMPGWGWWG